jgi:hypothetical protein
MKMTELQFFILFITLLVISHNPVCAAQEMGKEKGPDREEGAKHALRFSLKNDAILVGTPLDRPFTGKYVRGELGMYFETARPDGNRVPVATLDRDTPLDFFEDEYSFATAYLDLVFESPVWNGFQFAAGGMLVEEIWWDEDGAVVTQTGRVDFTDSGADWNSNYDVSAILHTLYLNYSIPGTRTAVLAGRGRFRGGATLNGDMHEGIEITVEDIPHTTVHACVLHRWIDTICPGEIDEDISLDDEDWTHEDAGGLAYSVSATLHGDMWEISPFYMFHPEVVSTYGASGRIEWPVSETLTLGLDGTYALHEEETDGHISSSDEDWHQWLVHVSAAYQGFSGGIGRYASSDDELAAGATGLFTDDLSPLEALGGARDTVTNYVHGAYDFGAIEIGAMYGSVSDGKPICCDEGKEMDAWARFRLTESLSLEVLYAHVTFDDGDVTDDYDYWEGALSWSF